MTELDKDEQFYRDTESIAFPKLDDRQLAMLEPLGARRIVRRGELVHKAGQRNLGTHLLFRFPARSASVLNPQPFFISFVAIQ